QLLGSLRCILQACRRFGRVSPARSRVSVCAREPYIMAGRCPRSETNVTKEKLELVEVSPRDGLQNEPDVVSTENKLALINHILAAGFRRLEAGSFVNPKKVPQMADGDAVFAGLPKRADASFIALALNLRGVERAIAAGAKEINYVFCASDGFSIRNNGGTVDETFKVWPEVAAAAKAGGARLSATGSTAVGCPFDGEVPVRRV